MSYKEFIWFLLSEEDKTTNRRYTHTRTHAHTLQESCIQVVSLRVAFVCPKMIDLNMPFLLHCLPCPLLHSIEYWFRCLDIDGDGCLSLYEMEQFYSEMLDKMKCLGIEGLPLEDCLCQVCMLHMPPPRVHECTFHFNILETLKHTICAHTLHC